MATVNKTDRKKLFSTQIIGATVIFFRTDTGGEVCRVEGAGLMAQHDAVLAYGIKQLVQDGVSAIPDMEGKIKAMQHACGMLERDEYPRRQPAAVSVESAVEVMMRALGETREQIEARLGIVK